MKTTLTIKEDFLQEVKVASGAKTKKEPVEQTLEEFVKRRKAKKLMDLEGKIELKIFAFELVKKPRTRLFLLIILTIAIYHSVLLGLFSAWMKNHYYSHGFLIPLISFYLIVKDRNKLKQIKNSPSHHGILIASFGILLFFLDKYVFNVLFLSSVAMLIFVMGWILFAFGRKYLRTLLFPILFLLFMIPIPDVVLNLLLDPLQLIASKLGDIILKCFGIPVLRDGVYLHLAPFTVQVDKTCSSMHSLIALSALSFIIAYLMFDSLGKKMIIVASSIPLAIFGNGCRLVLILMLALWMGEGIFGSFFHPLSGKIFFLIELFILMIEAAVVKKIGRRWTW